jgi:hypothetical protein
MLTVLACFVVFLAFAGLMATGRLSALLALPAMALAVALVCRVPLSDVMHQVIQEGVGRLSGAMITTMIGAILAQVMTKFGIGHKLVRWAAEFSGDNPFVLAMGLLLVTAVLFSSMGGLGAVIMVGSVVLPVLLSVGLPGPAAAGVLLFGISLGGMFNLANWKLFMEVLQVPQAEIQAFVGPFSLLFAVVAALFVYVQGSPEDRRRGFGALATVVGLVAAGALWWWRGSALPWPTDVVAAALPWVQGAGATLLVLSWWRRRLHPDDDVPLVALLTPVLPLFCVLVLKMDIVPAFLVGILHGVMATWKPGRVNAATQAIFEGIQAVVPVLVLMMGIGMVLNAMMHPVVSAQFGPVLAKATPSHALTYVAGFGLAAPLSLYRGPLNLFGLGSGLAALILATGQLPGAAVMGMLQSVGQVQGVCDPTNTANVWIANQVGSSPARLMRQTLPWAWLAALLGLVLSAARYLA